MSTQTDFFYGNTDPFGGVQIAFGLQYDEYNNQLAESEASFANVAKMFNFAVGVTEKKNGVVTTK